MINSLVTGQVDVNFIYQFTCLHLYSLEGVYMSQKNVTLSLDEDTYEEYREFCKKNAIALSRSIEMFMEDKIKREQK